MRRSLFVMISVLLAWAASDTIPLSAQDLTFTTITKPELPGPIGRVPGAQNETRQTTYIKRGEDGFMAVEGEDDRTIFEWRSGRFTVLQHPPKTFYSYTMEEMRARFAAVAGQGVEAREEWEEAREEEPDVQFEVRVSTERTGKTEDYGSHTTEEWIMTTEFVPKEGAAEGGAAGSMASVSLLELSTDFPGWEDFKRAQAEMAQGFMGEMGGSGMLAGLQQAFSDPGMKEALEKNLEEVKELEGMVVNNVTCFVMLAPGTVLNKDAALAIIDQPLGSGMGAAMGEAAARGVRDAASRIAGGILGRRRQQEEPEAEAAPGQTVMMRITTKVEGVQTGPVSDGLRRPPSDYEEREPEWAGVGGGGTGS